MSDIKKEFEEAFKKFYGANDPRLPERSTFKGFFRDGDRKIALWGTLWMAEKAAKVKCPICHASTESVPINHLGYHEISHPVRTEIYCEAEAIRQLAKELSVE